MNEHDEDMASWGWKLATSIEDAHAFINGEGAYTSPVGDVRIAARQDSGGSRFYLWYTSKDAGRGFGGWGWKRTDSVNDAHAFINGTGAYGEPVRDFEICMISGTFYVFYAREPAQT